MNRLSNSQLCVIVAIIIFSAFSAGVMAAEGRYWWALLGVVESVIFVSGLAYEARHPTEDETP